MGITDLVPCWFLCFDGHVSVILSLVGERAHTAHLQRHVILSATWDS